MRRKSEFLHIASIALVLLLLFLTEDCVFFPLFNVIPGLMVAFAVAVGICEGPYYGAYFGAAAGLLLDVGKNYAYGVSALFLIFIGMMSGLLIEYFRRTAVTCVVFTLAGAVFFYVCEWFFLYYLWYGGGRFLSVVPLQVLYSVVFSAPVYFAVCGVSRKFGKLGER